MDEEYTDYVDTADDPDTSDLEVSEDVSADIPNDIPEDVPEDEEIPEEDFSDEDVSDEFEEDISEADMEECFGSDESAEIISEDFLEGTDGTELTDEEIDLDEEIPEDIELAEVTDTEQDPDKEISADDELSETTEYLSSYDERRQQTPKEYSDDGFERWSGERGESLCRSDDEKVNRILDEYDLDGIEYKDCIPDFTPVSRGNVEILEMSDDRNGKNGNFNQADIALAQERGCNPRDVRQWRQTNGYTWHECNDMRTCQKVPSCINSKFGHLGGVSECKKAANIDESWEDEFDELP